MLLSTDPRIVSFFDHYHALKDKNPVAYAPASHPNCVNVVLPVDLKDYCNAAAGTSGKGSNYAPVGIRVKSDNPSADIAKIFSSHLSLAEFVNSSDCTGMALSISKQNGTYVKPKRVAKPKTIRFKNPNGPGYFTIPAPVEA
jgi:hypothetical protein